MQADLSAGTWKERKHNNQIYLELR